MIAKYQTKTKIKVYPNSGKVFEDRYLMKHNMVRLNEAIAAKISTLPLIKNSSALIL